MERRYNFKSSKWMKIFILMLVSSLLIYCSSSEDDVPRNEESSITKNSNVLELLKLAIEEDGTGQQCSGYKYPINFLVKSKNEGAFKPTVIISDEDLEFFINSLTLDDRLRIDFPVVLMDDENNETVVNSVNQLEETLQLTLDACSGSVEYEYCHTNNKKVYVCHNNVTICISINALQTHLNHGDALGQCQ